MIYPLSLMLAGSVKSEADSWSISPYPEFWFDDVILFQKYAEAKYNSSAQTAQNSWLTPILSWRTIKVPVQVPEDCVSDLREWRRTIPAGNRNVGFTFGMGILPKNLRSFRAFMSNHFNGSIEEYNKVAGQLCPSLSGIRPPQEIIGRYKNRNVSPEFSRIMDEWRETIPAEDLIVSGARGHYALSYLYGIYTSRIENYNAAHGTYYKSYGDIPLTAQVPKTDSLERKDWEKYVRNDIYLGYIRLKPALQGAFAKFVRGNYPDIAAFNAENETEFLSFEDIPFPEKLDSAPYLRQDFEAFIKDSAACPAEMLEIDSEDQSFQKFVEKKRGSFSAGHPSLGRIVEAEDWIECKSRRLPIIWEFTMRNYLQVLGYLAMHGNGLLNTLIYCSLAVATALMVNPLAAYALSRFRLPSTYKILLFCMATMAFPGEVTMIPAFLLLKRFPLWPIIAGIAICLILFVILEKLLPKIPENLRALLSLAAGLVCGIFVLPSISDEFASTSLLNTYAALVLPGMANGYFIFLLKGFFDSMPKELYEAADIDGASEWTKFWMLTMNLSKPILAVIALGAFTGAYSAFMMALIIIPDQSMWTIMVWIFELQGEVHQSVVYASLVIAAIPTFTIFVLCQNVIMRGIVVPTEK